MSDNSFMPPPPPPSFGTQGESMRVGEAATFGNVLSIVLRKYAEGKGRATRSEYWYFALWGVVIYFAGLMLTGVLTAVSEELAALGALAWMLMNLALIIPSITVTVRRLHDTNKSAHYLWFILLPFVGGIALLVFMLQPSDLGQNNYGPQPN